MEKNKKQLINEIKSMQKNILLSKKINSQLKKFNSFKNKSSNEWFSELCFCILTANSKAETAIKIQNELGAKGFIESPSLKIKKTIKKHKHRFHNNKTKFILEARKHLNIKKELNELLKKEEKKNAREFLVKNIKGIGMKEASHFLRNTGAKNLAILDRHILNVLNEYNIIKQKPKALNKINYLKIEKKFLSLANELKMNAAELDLFMWFMKTGKILK
ncbi:MAG: N-glycosylase/DNA lyase [Candidatus Diapherotrites archaeon]